MFRIASAKLKGCVRIRPSEQEHILNKYTFYTFVLATTIKFFRPIMKVIDLPQGNKGSSGPEVQP